MSEYEKSQNINAPATTVFAWVSDVANLPHYLPEVKEARSEGQASAGKPGEKVSLRVGVPGQYEGEGEGFVSVKQNERRMEWGSEMGRDYSGWLSVSEVSDTASIVTVHLNFGEKSVEEQVQEESPDDKDPFEDSLGRALESIRRQIEEGSGKLEPENPRES